MSDSDSSDDEVGFSNLFKTTYTNQSITLDSLSPSSFTTETPSFSAPSSSASPSSSAAASSSSSSSSPTDVETITEYVKVYQLKLSQAATTDYDKTGEILWPAAYSLARFMAVNSHRFFNGKTVLELGAGMGLPSIVLLGNSKPSVLIGSDHQSSILTILRENMDRASKQAPRYLERTVELGATAEAETEESTGGRKRTIVSEREVQFEQATSSLPAVAWDTAKFEWGKPEHIAAIRSQALRLLNRQDEHFEGFDFIIASDVVYSSDAVAGLLTSVRALLRPDSGRFIMAHRTRWAIVDRALAAAWADSRISRAVDADAFTAVSIPDDEQIFIQSLDS